MANAIYPLYKQSVLSADASSDLLQTTANVAPYVAMVNTSSYTYSSSHQFYSSLAGVVGTDQQITSPATTNGTFSGANVTFTSVTGSTVGALVIYRKNAGANTTWRLVMYEDTSVTGLPVTPNGGNIVITWNGSGIFTISDDSVKEDVEKIGRRGPLNVYSYRYRGSRIRHRGFMASEVKAFAPDAVRRQAYGLLAVNYDAVRKALAA
jgi:hypothetical protein